MIEFLMRIGVGAARFTLIGNAMIGNEVAQIPVWCCILFATSSVLLLLPHPSGGATAFKVKREAHKSGALTIVDNLDHTA
jgi:hypothetical protein